MHSFRSKTHILGILKPFRCSTTSLWFRTTYFTSKTRVSGGFTPFHCRTWPIVKISIGCIKCTSLCLRNHILFCRNEHALSTISVQNSCFGWFHAKIGIEVHLMHEFLPLEPFLAFKQWTCCKNWYRGTFNAQVYASRTFFFAANMSNPLL